MTELSPGTLKEKGCKSPGTPHGGRGKISQPGMLRGFQGLMKTFHEAVGLRFGSGYNGDS